MGSIGEDDEIMTSDVPELDCQAPEIDAAELTRGKQVGSGCTAQVYKGTWRDKVVAIKVIDIKMCTSKPRDQIMLSREVSVLAKINHENCVAFYGISFSQRPLQIVSEFCEGGTVFDLCHSDVDITWLQQHKMICDVAHAMRYLHNLQPQIIHRDLKSLNLLLSKPVEVETDVPFVKVTDFGFSRIKDMEQDWGKMTKNMGTCHWMAPEVVNGTRYDEKADVYSFAIVIYEIICLTVPFGDLEPEEAARRTARGQRPSMEEVPPDCPAPLSKLMESCWAHAAANRPSFERILVTLEGPVAQALGASSRAVSL
jgi:serine/threonine protein kinase